MGLGRADVRVGVDREAGLGLQTLLVGCQLTVRARTLKSHQVRGALVHCSEHPGATDRNESLGILAVRTVWGPAHSCRPAAGSG